MLQPRPLVTSKPSKPPSLLSTPSPNFVFVVFPIAVIKCPNTNNLKDGSGLRLTVPGYSPSWVGKPWQQEHEAAGHTAYTDRKQKVMDTSAQNIILAPGVGCSCCFLICHHVKSQQLALPLPWVEPPAMLPTTAN